MPWRGVAVQGRMLWLPGVPSWIPTRPGAKSIRQGWCQGVATAAEELAPVGVHVGQHADEGVT